MSHIKAILALMIVAWPFKVQPLSRDTFQCTPVYIYIDVSLWWGIYGLCILWNSFDLRCESVIYQKCCQFFCTLYLYGCTVAVCFTTVIINCIITFIHYSLRRCNMAHLTPNEMVICLVYRMGLRRKAGENRLQKSYC